MPDARYDNLYAAEPFGGGSGAAPEPLGVSDAMALAKTALETLTLTIVGEVSEFSNKSGYKAVYFTIKDESSSLSCMMWMNRFRAAGIELGVGALVQVTGRFTLYAAKGRMNFDVSSITLAGEGNLRLKVANLEKALRAEGLMDAARKRPLPAYPLTIGVVTSPRGAAVRDVLRTLRRRYPQATVQVAGVPVEGAHAPEGLCQALRCLDASSSEVILLVRGGGSFEDLMPFNDETLARTIASLGTPVVTGIGHEPDTCIADLVADHRASTPTAAAEAVSPDTADLSRRLGREMLALGAKLRRRLDYSAEALAKTSSRPVLSDPRSMFSSDAMHLENMSRALELGGTRMVEDARKAVVLRASRLNDLSPSAVLARGYCMASTCDGKIVKHTADVAAGDDILLKVSDGALDCKVVGVACERA